MHGAGTAVRRMRIGNRYIVSDSDTPRWRTLGTDSGDALITVRELSSLAFTWAFSYLPAKKSESALQPASRSKRDAGLPRIACKRAARPRLPNHGGASASLPVGLTVDRAHGTAS